MRLSPSCQYVHIHILDFSSQTIIHLDLCRACLIFSEIDTKVVCQKQKYLLKNSQTNNITHQGAKNQH